MLPDCGVALAATRRRISMAARYPFSAEYSLDWACIWRASMSESAALNGPSNGALAALKALVATTRSGLSDYPVSSSVHARMGSAHIKGRGPAVEAD
jgi:hypothetical protein